MVRRRGAGACRLDLNRSYALNGKARFGRNENDLIPRLCRESERQIQELARKLLMNEKQPQDSNPVNPRSNCGLSNLTVNGVFSLERNYKI